MISDTIFTATIRHYLSPIEPYLADVGVAEVMINGPYDIFIEKGGRIEKVDARFADEEAYDAAINNILQYTGKSLTDDSPLVDTRLPDGSRVHVAKRPCARNGMVVTIRKFAKSTLDIDWLIELGTLTRQAREYLQIAVVGEQNLLVAGGTSSGKTSLLNALSTFIPAGQRIVVIEDSAELQLQQDHVISLEARPPDRFGRGAIHIRELFRSSLRLRPDRIIIGEVRGGEALDMIQAMTSGHGGSMGTLHANNAFDALNRLETMAMMSQVELPLQALRSQVASAIDVIVHLSRQVGGRRLVTGISEVMPLGEADHYQLRDIFQLRPDPADPAGRTTALTWTGQPSSFTSQLDHDTRQLITDRTKALFTAPAPTT